MKVLLAVLFAMPLLYAAPPDEFPDAIAIESEPQEIAAFDFPIQQSIPLALPENIPPPVPIPHKNAFLAVSLSSLVPGLGHAYLGDMKTAGGLMGSTCLNWACLAFPNTAIQFTGLVTLESIWSYGLYAAYRDVRIYNKESGYSYQMPTNSFADLALAPFRLSVLKKPEVWGGFLGALALAVGVGYFAYPQDAHIQLEFPPEIDMPLIAFPVGIGEESLFRGYLQSQLSEFFSPWGGIAISSLAFGAMHVPNALFLAPESRWRYYTFSIPLITGMGAYFGWLTYKNRSLKESVALHTWYDFTLLAAGFLASRVILNPFPRFTMAIPWSF